MKQDEDEDQRVKKLIGEITKLLPERSKIKTDLLYFKYVPILVMLMRWYGVSQFYGNIESMLGFGSKAMSCLKKMKQERMGERMPDYRDDWRREREERENRRRFNNVNDDWNYPNRYGERGGGGYNGGGR